MQPHIFHYLDGVGEWTEASSDAYYTQDVEYVSVDSSGCLYIASRSYTYCDEIPEHQEEDETAKENGKDFVVIYKKDGFDPRSHRILFCL